MLCEVKCSFDEARKISKETGCRIKASEDFMGWCKVNSDGIFVPVDPDDGSTIELRYHHYDVPWVYEREVNMFDKVASEFAGYAAYEKSCAARVGWREMGKRVIDLFGHIDGIADSVRSMINDSDSLDSVFIDFSGIESSYGKSIMYAYPEGCVCTCEQGEMLSKILGLTPALVWIKSIGEDGREHLRIDRVPKKVRSNEKVVPAYTFEEILRSIPAYIGVYAFWMHRETKDSFFINYKKGATIIDSSKKCGSNNLLPVKNYTGVMAQALADVALMLYYGGFIADYGGNYVNAEDSMETCDVKEKH